LRLHQHQHAQPSRTADTTITTAERAMSTSTPSLPNTYRLAPLSSPSAYISLNSNDSNASLTTNLSLALVLYTQTLTPDPTIDFKICTTNNDTSIYQPINACLDQWGNNVTQATLRPAEAVTGQAWNRTWSDRSSDGGTGGWTLRSEFGGPKRRLAVDKDGVTVIMEQGEGVGQANALWTFDDAGAVVSASGTTASTASTTASEPTGDPSTSSRSTDVPVSGYSSDKGGLSSGAIAGIAIGAVAAVLLFVAFFFLWRRRRRRQRAFGAGVPASKIDGIVGRQELLADEKMGKAARARPAELQDTRRTELEGSAPKEKGTKQVFELPTT
jgi:hypothetical protein